MRRQARDARTPGGWAAMAAGLVALAMIAGVAAAQPCDDADECTVADTCEANGTCTGTPKANGTPCDDGNACTVNDACSGGTCAGTMRAPDGSPCTSFLGPCATGATCLFGVCVPTGVRECPDDGNLCTFEFCNPQTGQCESSLNDCRDECRSGQCHPASGECTNVQTEPDGAACDDGNECTANDGCRQGACVANAAAATPTPVPSRGLCVGDCDRGGVVTVDELVRGVNIALGTAVVEDCLPFDADGNGAVTVDELVQAVNAALNGCLDPTPTASPAVTATPGPLTPSPVTVVPTVTPSRTPTSSTGPTSTPAAGAVTRRAAGMVQTTTSAVLVIPNLVTVLLSGINALPGGTAQEIFSVPFSCPGGGNGELTCSQDIIVGIPPRLGPPVYLAMLNGCQLNTGGGALTLSGSVLLTGKNGDVCGTIPSSIALSIPALTMALTTSQGTTTASFAGVSGSVTLAGDDEQCGYDQIGLQLVGDVGLVIKDSDGDTVVATQIGFEQGSSIAIAVTTYGAQCLPVVYTTVLNGGLSFTTGDNSFAANYIGYAVATDASVNPNQLRISGGVESSCFGTTVTLSTPEPVLLPPGAACPIGGKILVSASSVTDALLYTSTQEVSVDLGNNGSIDQTYPTCVDPRLFDCPS